MACRLDERAREDNPMIRNDEALAFLRKQLALMEHSLAELRREVKNERNFQVLSEGYVDQIAELKAEIAKYQRAAKKESANGKRKKPRPRQKAK